MKPYRPTDSEKVKKLKSDLAQARAGKMRNVREMQAGKGDAPRPVNQRAYMEGWERIWGVDARSKS